MTVALDQFFADIDSGDGPYASLPAGTSVVFDLHGEGGGVWCVKRSEAGEVAVGRRSPARPDCRMRCSVEHFRALVAGDLEVRRAFMQGFLDVEGDIGLIWRMQKILISRAAS